MSKERHILKSDQSKCKKCFMCEKVSVGFMKVSKGEIDLPVWQTRQGHTKKVIKDLIRACPHDAITCEKIVKP